MKFILTTTSVCFLLMGCAGLTPYRPFFENISKPELNTVAVANIGDTMIAQGKVGKIPAINIMSSWDNYTVTKGLYKKIGEQQDFEVFKPIEKSGASIKTSLGRECFLALNKKNKLYYACYGGYGNIWKIDEIDKQFFERIITVLELTENFQQYLIYSGKEKDSIKISYREFTDNLARPAFTNDVTYDLKENKIIGYKQALIEIIEATNTSIKYRVIKNFN